jgi:hypothetical protein
MSESLFDIHIEHLYRRVGKCFYLNEQTGLIIQELIDKQRSTLASVRGITEAEEFELSKCLQEIEARTCYMVKYIWPAHNFLMRLLFNRVGQDKFCELMKTAKAEANQLDNYVGRDFHYENDKSSDADGNNSQSESLDEVSNQYDREESENDRSLFGDESESSIKNSSTDDENTAKCSDGEKYINDQSGDMGGRSDLVDDNELESSEEMDIGTGQNALTNRSKSQQHGEGGNGNNAVLILSSTRTKKDRNTILAEGRQMMRNITSQLSTYPLVVANLPIFEYVRPKLEHIFDPSNPQLSQISSLAQDLVTIMQNLSRYSHKLKVFELAYNNDKSRRVIEVMNSSSSIGAILCCIAKTLERECDEEEIDPSVLSSLSHLKAATKRANIGSNKWRSNRNAEMTRSDVGVLKKIFTMQHYLKNLISNCLSLHVIINGVEPHLTMHQLFQHTDHRGDIQSAENLFNAIFPGVTFDAESISMRAYREKVVMPALLVDDLKHLAVKVSWIMSTKLTDTRGGHDNERRRMILPYFQRALCRTVQGEQVDCEDDFCGGTGYTHIQRRSKMASVVNVSTASTVIEGHLPAGKFPNGMLHSILIQSPSYIRDSFNFKNVDQFDQFFKTDKAGRFVVHGEQSDIVQEINIGWHAKHEKEQAIIIDSNSVSSLRRLLLVDTVDDDI